jgi:hypothetical protein
VRLFKKSTPEVNAEGGTRNAESGNGNAEGGTRNAESGPRNAEGGTRKAKLEDEDVGLAEAIDASLSGAERNGITPAGEIPHSEFRVPHSDQIPHSALRVPHSNEIPHSALRVPHLRHGPHRVALCDLKRGTDRAGEEIFIQSEEEHTRRPLIWYKRDRRGNTSKFVRDGWGSTASNLGPSAFL